MPDTPSPAASEAVLALLAETAAVSRHQIVGDTVRVSTVTHTIEQAVDAELSHERVEIERVPINRAIEAVPEIRQEGDTTILPVVEEVVVVERRLILREEVRVRRVRATERHHETVMLRQQDAVITRVAAASAARGPATETGSSPGNYDALITNNKE